MLPAIPLSMRLLGILKPFAPDERMKKILAESARVGDATARAIFYGSRTPDGFFMRTVREYASSRRAPLSSNLIRERSRDASADDPKDKS